MVTFTNCSFTGNTTSSTGVWINTTGTSTATTTAYTDAGTGEWTTHEDHVRIIKQKVPILPGSVHPLPDGAKLFVDMNGNYEVIEHNAKVTYKANRNHEFNQYINTSDLLEDFIRDLGKLGVKQNEVLDIPIEAFINWLVIKAAESDGEPVPQDVPKLAAPQKHRCRDCGRFLNNDMKQAKLDFCDADHYQHFLLKSAA